MELFSTSVTTETISGCQLQISPTKSTHLQFHRPFHGMQTTSQAANERTNTCNMYVVAKKKKPPSHDLNSHWNTNHDHTQANHPRATFIMCRDVPSVSTTKSFPVESLKPPAKNDQPSLTTNSPAKNHQQSRLLVVFPTLPGVARSGHRSTRLRLKALWGRSSSCLRSEASATFRGAWPGVKW